MRYFKMKMKLQYRKGGYSKQTAEQYVNLQAPIYLFSTEPELQQKFEDGKPTSDIVAYKIWVGQKGLPPFQVKLLEEPNLPEYLSLISFDNLQACEVNYNVYFKADGIKEVK